MMLKTAIIFGDNMVIQRQKKFKVWGTGLPGKEISGTLKGKNTQIVKGVVQKDGSWMLTFPPLEAEKNVLLSITDGRDTLSYQNIGVGEVWLAGGQSNMEYYLQFDAEKEQVIKGEMNPDIRFFDYPKVSYEGQIEEHDYFRFGLWRGCTPEDLLYFSAVGYYFAANLHEKLDIPIGVVGCNWGGTPACTWMDPDYLKDNEGKAWLESYEEDIAGLNVEDYKADFKENPMNDHSDPFRDERLNKMMFPGFSQEEQLELIQRMSAGEQVGISYSKPGPYWEKRPGGLYESMLKQIAPYGIRGVIWYQGESDDERAALYGTVFSKLIECWRDLWADKLPFLFVQLAPFGEWMQNLPEVRRQQELVSQTIPDTWMASSSDAGMEWDIHPKYKKPIGTRLALLARAHIYGENILSDPPEFLSATRIPGGIVINIRHANGLHVKGDKVNAISLTERDGTVRTPAEISVINDQLWIKGEFPEQIKISFANQGYYEVNVYNNQTNPMKPFQVIV
ncbi:sialate O-acetylesterase [Paenibacillus sp. 37]|uniref:sialate O-acetylesterase n=1 Tax=Paenibacillus sp. 37 TaxID=2607911 RepID=UPI00122DD1AA|nr:sialate O-acetylesterase [Paenibacillus sp. 37]